MTFGGHLEGKHRAPSCCAQALAGQQGQNKLPPRGSLNLCESFLISQEWEERGGGGKGWRQDAKGAKTETVGQTLLGSYSRGGRGESGGFF